MMDLPPAPPSHVKLAGVTVVFSKSRATPLTVVAAPPLILCVKVSEVLRPVLASSVTMPMETPAGRLAGPVPTAMGLPPRRAS